MARIPKMTKAEFRALLRTDFTSFIERGFYQLNPTTKLLMNWHIEVMADKLDACRRGIIKRLIINVSPRSLKSLCASVALPAWILGHNPAEQVLCVSYGQELADKLARDCRTIMTTGWYQDLFATRLSQQKQSVAEFVTTAGGYRMATSVGGVLTGRGANFIIIDDSLKPVEALSDALRRSANDWYDNTLYSRLNDKRTGCIILIMQRLHEDDLVGHVLEREGWEVLSFPAIAEQDERYLIETPYGQRRFARRAGEALHPEREPLNVLASIRASIGERNFVSQYLQAPAPLEGGLVKRGWFKTYTDLELPESFDQIVQSWDSANSPTELANYSVCTTWGIKGKRIYLLHVYRKRVGYPELKRAVHEQAALHKATLVLIEDKASGTQLCQELINEGLRIVKAVRPEGDKVMRFNAQTATIENGFVYLPREASWLADYIHEITSFPSSKYNDQADSTSQALAWINMQPESVANGLYRNMRAREMYRGDIPIEVIAAKLNVTPDEIKEILAMENKVYDPLAGYRLRIMKRCHECGEEFTDNVEWSVEDGKIYHATCRQKRSSGR
jgi:predicted phage terminase large subunit-like protein